MKSACKLIALILAFCFVFSNTVIAAEKKDSSAVSVDANGTLLDGNDKLNGLYKDVYYQNGQRANSYNGIKRFSGIEYYIRQGKVYTGTYGTHYYKNGLWYSNGKGSGLEFADTASDEHADKASAMSISDGYNLLTGPYFGMYYENGNVDKHFTGFKSFQDVVYYVVKGRLFNGYYDGCYYKNGIADTAYEGVHKVGNEEYCFMAGYFYTGLYKGIYYIDGKRSSDSGYTTIDNVRYYLVDGAAANGIYDGAYMKNGLVDTSINGERVIDGVVYTFRKGITSDGLHDGKWYENGDFASDFTGVKIFNKTAYYLKNGVLGTGFAKDGDALKYFKNGVVKPISGWFTVGKNKYYLKDGEAYTGIHSFRLEELELKEEEPAQDDEDTEKKETAETDENNENAAPQWEEPKVVDGKVNCIFDAQGRLCMNRDVIYQKTVYSTDENGIAVLAPQFFYSQRGSDVPYANAHNPNATISSSGCGVCACLMVIENSTNYRISLEDIAKLFIEKGCRAYSGTDMVAAAKVLESEYGFEYKTTSSNEELREHLKKGYMAVADVGAVPLFSLSGGHFVTVVGLKDDDTVIIKDPSVKPGKYGEGIRSAIEYNPAKEEVYASFDTLYADTHNQRYFLFTPTEKVALRKTSTKTETN